MTEEQVKNQVRCLFLMSMLMKSGVIHWRENGTWVLRGICGVDDSDLRGIGATPEQAIDNAIETAMTLSGR